MVYRLIQSRIAINMVQVKQFLNLIAWFFSMNFANDSVSVSKGWGCLLDYFQT